MEDIRTNQRYYLRVIKEVHTINGIYKDATRFGTKDCLCNAIKEICYLYHSPKRGPARSMLRGYAIIEDVIIEVRL